jgi:AbrB family looped-hinge helix DNA binding protein
VNPAVSTGTPFDRFAPVFLRAPCGKDFALALGYSENKAMAETTLSAKNQVKIPLEARKALGLKPGDKVLIIVRRRTLLILRKPKSYRVAIRGLARGAYPENYLEKERRSWR